MQRGKGILPACWLAIKYRCKLARKQVISVTTVDRFLGKSKQLMTSSVNNEVFYQLFSELSISSFLLVIVFSERSSCLSSDFQYISSIKEKTKQAKKQGVVPCLLRLAIFISLGNHVVQQACFQKSLEFVGQLITPSEPVEKKNIDHQRKVLLTNILKRTLWQPRLILLSFC